MPRSCRGRARTIARVEPAASSRLFMRASAPLSGPPDRPSGPPDALSGPPDTLERLAREPYDDALPLSGLDRDAPLDDDRRSDHELTAGPHARHHRLMPDDHRICPGRDLLEHEMAALVAHH